VGARFCVFINKVSPEILEGRSLGGPGRPSPGASGGYGKVSVLGLALMLKKHPAVDRVVLGALRGRGSFLVIA
jgi:hypothetical protein